jgi:hypothetical protein
LVTAIIGGTLALALAGCSSGPAAHSSSGSTTTSTSAPAAPKSPTTTPTTGGAQNLPVTDAIRSQLVQAGAALNHLSSSDYTGLRAGSTFYAYDPATSTYWAAAAMDPSSASMAAQVASQDDGSYLLFTQPTGGGWTAQNDGLGGIDGTPCPAIPASVVAAWDWLPGSCKPPT